MRAGSPELWRVYCAKAIEKTSSGFAYDHGVIDPEKEEVIGDYIYVGPWTISCDHGCFHGDGTHGCSGLPCDKICFHDDAPRGCDGHTCDAFDRAEVREKVARACEYQVMNADLVYAVLSKPEQYGTVVEIAMAFGAYKPVIINILPKLFGRPLREYWFVVQMAINRAPAAELFPLFPSVVPFRTRDAYIAHLQSALGGFHFITCARPLDRDYDSDYDAQVEYAEKYGHD